MTVEVEEGEAHLARLATPAITARLHVPAPMRVAMTSTMVVVLTAPANSLVPEDPELLAIFSILGVHVW